VREEGKRGPAAALCPRDEVGAVRLAGEELALEAACCEVVTKELGGARLVAGWIDRVEPEQPLQELSYFIAELGGS
jgi:hypothetical protein